MKTTMSALIAMIIAICSVCPSMMNHPASLGQNLEFALRQPAVTAEVLSKKMMWCDWCGEPCKVKKLKWIDTKEDCFDQLLCPICRKIEKERNK